MPTLVFRRTPLTQSELVGERGVDGSVAAVASREVLEVALQGVKALASACDEAAALRGGGGGEFSRHATTPALALYPAPDSLDRVTAGRYFKLTLVATGSYLFSDASRPILKRCVLSGYPTKVKARFASVRYMFFNPADVAYFKPVEIYTKDARARGAFKGVWGRGFCLSFFSSATAIHSATVRRHLLYPPPLTPTSPSLLHLPPTPLRLAQDTYLIAWARTG